MILIRAYITIVPAYRADFLRLIGELAQATRAEADCLSFACYEDISAPDTFVVLGEWADQTALGAHEQSHHVAQFKAQAAPLILSRQPTRVYSVDHVGGL